MADLEIVAASYFENLPDALRERIVARAIEIYETRDGEGIARLEAHRPNQESLLTEARRDVESDLRAAALPKPATTAQLAQWPLEKLAFGKKRSPENQRQLVLHIQNSEGLSMAAASAKAEAIAKTWGTSLGNVAIKGTNPHKRELEAAKLAGKTEAETFGGIPDTGFNRDVSMVKPDGGGKPSKNPYKNEMTPATQKEIAGIIARKGTAFAASLAKAAGKTISGHPLIVK